METKEIFSKKLVELREERKLTKKELAEKLEISAASLGYYENGERLPDISTACKIADFFDITCDELVRGVKAENVDIYKKIGLSDVAIEVLKKRKTECKGCQSFNQNFSFNTLISLLISNEYFNSAIHYLCGCLNIMNMRKIKKPASNNDKITLKIFDDGYSMITIDEHVDYYKYLINNYLDNSIQDIIQSYENNVNKEGEENAEHNPTIE